MKYVLDTCTFFWLADDQSKLSEWARNVLTDADNGPSNGGQNSFAGYDNAQVSRLDC
jgi:hypothetical protein